jgi:putative flippase GtrA
MTRAGAPVVSRTPMEPISSTRQPGTAGRIGSALGRRSNWAQLAAFCVVGAAGYVINLIVYAVLLNAAGLHYIAAAVGSFLVAVTNNYLLNRRWTFRRERGHVGRQGLRFLIVSSISLGANLLVLHLFVQAGLGKIIAQAIAIVLVTPLNFVGNKLWSFGRR